MPANSSTLTHEIFEALIQPGPRIPWVENWLLNEVWSQDRFQAADDVVQDYLLPGERMVKNLEDILSTAAQRVYDELIVQPAPEKDLYHFLKNCRPCAAVVFDGLSLREIPLLLRLAERSGFRIAECSTSLAAIPAETLDFTQQRLRLNSRVAPSTLPGRGELRAEGISSTYYDSARDRRSLDPGNQSMLLWSAFPDQTYRDSEAKFDRHFANLQAILETAWQNTVQQIPGDRSIVVTSDHGYVYFGAGCASARSYEALRPLNQHFGGERFSRILDDNVKEHPDIKFIDNQQLFMLRGRVQTHTTGGDSAKLYKHGGLSLMEMMTPWIRLNRS